VAGSRGVDRLLTSGVVGILRRALPILSYSREYEGLRSVSHPQGSGSDAGRGIHTRTFGWPSHRALPLAATKRRIRRELSLGEPIYAALTLGSWGAGFEENRDLSA